MLNLIGAIFSGLFIGVLARFFYPGAVPLGWIMTILLGIGGSLLASLVAGRATGGYGDGLNRAGCLASVLGAMALIFLGRQLGWH
ncbi:MAG: GlsB/YeaQ/YmgE family stress response membrane protein [Sphingomonadales bacterium]|nr:GlsB/YeaQ/YmgE family stress response membrane protein [Sphingomonadales bacterium]MBU3992966.1 GlsB/YeaQ/YmgE family stress response membrane protein [Alphaproteobacteria bacterium]